MTSNALYDGEFIDLTSEAEPQSNAGSNSVMFLGENASKSKNQQNNALKTPLKTYSKRGETPLSKKSQNLTHIILKSSGGRITAEQKKINPVSVFSNKAPAGKSQAATNLVRSVNSSPKTPQPAAGPTRSSFFNAEVQISPKPTPCKTQSCNLIKNVNSPPKSTQPAVSGCSTSSLFDDEVQVTSSDIVLTPSSSEIRRKKFPVDPLVEANENSDDDVILVPDQSDKSGDFAEIRPIRNGVRSDLSQKNAQSKIVNEKTPTLNKTVKTAQNLNQKLVTTRNQKVTSLNQNQKVGNPKTVMSPKYKILPNSNQKLVQNSQQRLTDAPKKSIQGSQIQVSKQVTLTSQASNSVTSAALKRNTLPEIGAQKKVLLTDRSVLKVSQGVPQLKPVQPVKQTIQPVPKKSNVSNIIIKSVYSVRNPEDTPEIQFKKPETLISPPKLAFFSDKTNTEESTPGPAKILSPNLLNQTVMDHVRQQILSQRNLDRVARTATLMDQLKSKPQTQNNLADIVETANAVAAITPNGDEVLSDKGNPLVFLLYPVGSDSAPSGDGQLKQVLALVPSNSDLANNAPPLKTERDLDSEFITCDDLNSSKSVAKEAEVAPPPVFVPVDINQIINRGKKFEISGRCHVFDKKYDGTFLKGFTRSEKRKSSCIKAMQTFIKDETKKIAEMKKAAKERYESNIVYCGTAENYFLPENVEVKFEYENLEELPTDDDNLESLPTISEVISQVNKEVSQMREAQEKQKRKAREPHQSKAEEALSLIKKGLELIQSLSLEAGKANETEKERPKRKRAIGINVRKDDVVKKKRRPKQVEVKEVVVKRRRVKKSEIDKGITTVRRRVNRKGAKSKGNSQNDESSDDLLVVRRVDIIKSDGKVKKARGRRKKLV